MSVNYDRLDSLGVDGLRAAHGDGAALPSDSRIGVANVAISAKTMVIAARMGVTDKFDIGMAVPIVTIKVNGTTSLSNGNGQMLLFGTGINTGPGLGDVAGLAKYRFYSFGTGQPDPGGFAVMATVRLPTGDTKNLRGLGVTRTLLSFIASRGPASSGRMPTSGSSGGARRSPSVRLEPNDSVAARHQFEYAAGMEFEAAPKLTLLVDFLGRADPRWWPARFPPGRRRLRRHFHRVARRAVGRHAALSLAPGLKVNLKGKMLLSLNALIALHDQRTACPRHARGRHRFDLLAPLDLGTAVCPIFCATRAAHRPSSSPPLSMGAAARRRRRKAVVTVTQTTSTTTSTTTTTSTSSAARRQRRQRLAQREPASPRRRCFTFVCAPPVGRRSAVHVRSGILATATKAPEPHRRTSTPVHGQLHGDVDLDR